MGEGMVLAFFRLLSKNRRRYGGYLVHLSVIMLFVGFTGQAFTIERELVLDQGESAQIGRYSVTFDALAFGEDANKSVAAAAITLKHDDRHLATLIPERHFYKTAEQNTTEVSIYSRWLEDFYVIMVGIGADNQSAKFHIYINPLVSCVWWGSALLVLSSLWTMWPNSRDRRMARLDRDAVRAGGWQPALGGQPS